MTRLFPLILISLSILSAACTKELKYSKEELLKTAQAADASVTYILPKSIAEGVTCADYSDGCMSAHIVKVRGLEMIAVEFMTEEEAKLAAKKIRALYSRNWIFDDVTGEPLLEEFFTKYLDAKKP